MILNLRFVSFFKAPNGANFDLLADDQLKNFFIKLKQLWTASYAFHDGEPSPYFRKRLNQIFKANVRAGGTYVTFEVVALDDVKNFLDTEFIPAVSEKVFPYDIFEVVETPFPKRAEVVTHVKTIFHTDEDDPQDRIFIFNDGVRNLVSLTDISQLVFKQAAPLHSQIVKAGLCYDLFHEVKTGKFFIDLCDIFHFLRALDDSDKLSQRFKTQVCMVPTPNVAIFLDFTPKLITEIYFNGNEIPLKIYKGNGFAENAFFCSVENLTYVIGLDDYHLTAFDNANLVVGQLWCEDMDEGFCRLDHVPYIMRLCLARLWNGSNQDHPVIKNGWGLIHWFKDFLPNFYNQHAFTPCKEQFTRGARWLVNSLGFVDAGWELVDTPKLDTSLKEFFDTFDKACRNFKSQLLEAQS